MRVGGGGGTAAKKASQPTVTRALHGSSPRHMRLVYMPRTCRASGTGAGLGADFWFCSALQILRGTIPLLLPHRDAIAARTFASLFSEAPSLAQLFDMQTLRQHQNAFMSFIFFIAENVHNLDALKGMRLSARFIDAQCAHRPVSLGDQRSCGQHFCDGIPGSSLGRP